MKECGETDGVPQVTMHLQTFSYIFQNNILCKSDIYYGYDRLFIILVLVYYIVNVMLLFINHVVHQRLLKIWCHLHKCMIIYKMSPRFLCRPTTLYIIARAVERQSAIYTENSGFACPALGQHISTFRGYRILFSIRNPYINHFTNHFSIHS